MAELKRELEEIDAILPRCERIYTDSSIEAASFIYEDCRARGQSPEESLRKAVKRLIPA